MMLPHERFTALLEADAPLLTLAPMQEVTDGAFWALVHRYGGADVYWTEYFRVHADSTPECWIVDAIRHNPTGRPLVAQMIGNDIPALIRTAQFLMELPVVAIDLNLGCPAPIVYRKCAGGGLLREIDRVVSAVDAAILAGHSRLRLIHGRSGGRLRGAVHRQLRDLPSVRAFRLDPANEGVTIVEF